MESKIIYIRCDKSSRLIKYTHKDTIYFLDSEERLIWRELESGELRKKKSRGRID